MREGGVLLLFVIMICLNSVVLLAIDGVVSLSFTELILWFSLQAGEGDRIDFSGDGDSLTLMFWKVSLL